MNVDLQMIQTYDEYFVENEAMAIHIALNMIIAFVRGQSYVSANRECARILCATGWSSDRKLYVQKRSLEILEGLKDG